METPEVKFSESSQSSFLYAWVAFLLAKNNSGPADIIFKAWACL